MSLKLRISVAINILLAFVILHNPTYKKVRRVKSLLYFVSVPYTIGLYNSFNSPLIDKNLPKKFYVVNLDRLPNRMKLVEEQDQKFDLNIQRFPASDGALISFASHQSRESFTGYDIKNNRSYFRTGIDYNVFCSKESLDKELPDMQYRHAKTNKPILAHTGSLGIGELGLLCSYNRLWKKIANAPEDQIAVIFEDDILMYDNFKNQLDKIFAELPDKWDIIYLDYLTLSEDDISQPESESAQSLKKYSKLYKNAWGTHAYIINKNSAKKLLEIQEKHNNIPADSILLEGIKRGVLNTYISTVKMADQNPKFESVIESDGRGN